MNEVDVNLDVFHVIVLKWIVCTLDDTEIITIHLSLDQLDDEVREGDYVTNMTQQQH